MEYVTPVVSPDGNVTPVEALMSISAGLLPSTRLVPVADALATASGVAVGVGVADGRAVGVAVGVAVADGLAVGVAVGVGVADGRAVGVADAVGAGEALGSVVIEGAADGDAVGVAPRLMGVSVDEPFPQAVNIADEAQSASAAVPRRAKNTCIVSQSQARSKE